MHALKAGTPAEKPCEASTLGVPTVPLARPTNVYSTAPQPESSAQIWKMTTPWGGRERVFGGWRVCRWHKVPYKVWRLGLCYLL